MCVCVCACVCITHVYILRIYLYTAWFILYTTYYIYIYIPHPIYYEYILKGMHPYPLSQEDLLLPRGAAVRTDPEKLCSKSVQFPSPSSRPYPRTKENQWKIYEKSMIC